MRFSKPEGGEIVLTRLKHAVQMLALTADAQLTQLPDGVCKADELALDFDHWFEVATSNLRFNHEQTKALAAIDKKLASMTEAGSQYWTDEAVKTGAEWQVIRKLARDALALFAWQAEVPPSYAQEYVIRERERKD